MKLVWLKFVCLSLLLVGLAGCGDLLVGDDAAFGPEETFEHVWHEVDRLYAHFVVKDVDWDAAYAAYRPQVSAATNERGLFEVICAMLETLEDGHVNVFASFATCGYPGWYAPYPRNFDFVDLKTTYLNRGYAVAGGGRLTYGLLADGVGYLHVASFAGDGWVDEVDDVLAALGDLRALVVDVRDNGGGASRNAEALAGRFADREHLFAYVRYRNGPAHDDFAEPRAKYIRPEGARTFTGPIALLTNRRCYSACESFALSMDVLPHVVVVGDTTGGGFGNPVYRELPNGWSYRLPVWVQTDRDGRPVEDVGIAPDLDVDITPVDAARRRDTILEAAVASIE